jgi:putative PIN family toxin of toxin-antitoxin system
MGKKVAPPRVVLDTNVLVSALLFGGEPGKIHDQWVGKRLVPLISKETFAEFSKVLFYPKFQLSPAEITAIIEYEFLPYAEVVEIRDNVTGVCRDPQDDKFLTVAVSGHATYIVTGDQDLLVLQVFRKIRILTVRDFLALL